MLLALFLPSIAEPTEVNIKAVRFNRAERGSMPPRHISPTDSIISEAADADIIPMSEPPSPPIRALAKPDIAPASNSERSENAPTRDVGFLVKYDAIAKVNDTAGTDASETPAPMSNNIGRLSSFLFCLFIFSSEKVLLGKSYCHEVENMTANGILER